MYCFAAPRNVPRYKPHLQRNLLENFGFECVMQFNEFNQTRKREPDQSDGSDKSDSSDKENHVTGEPRENGMNDGESPVKSEPSEEDRLNNAAMETEDKVSEDHDDKKYDDNNRDEESDKKYDDDDDKESVDGEFTGEYMPEMKGRSVCLLCQKQFSSIWVLKAHQVCEQFLIDRKKWSL